MTKLASGWSADSYSSNDDYRMAGKRLEKGEAAALCIKALISKAEATSIVSSLLEVGIDYYHGDDKHGAVVKKGKVGPNFFRFKDDPSEYFDRAKKEIHVFNNDILHNVDIMKRVFDTANEAFGLNSILATHNGQDMMPCTIRDLPVASIHRDWLKGEVDTLDFLSDLRDQWAWNVYLTQPEIGGETSIYDVQDLSLLNKDTPSVTLKPKLGNLLFFRSTNIHEVSATQGDRYTLSGFCGPTNNGRLLFWV